MQTLRVLFGSVNSRARLRAAHLLAVLLAFSGTLATPQIFPAGHARNTVQAATSPTVSKPAAPSGEVLKKMPLNFTRNEGQTDPRVKFTARGRGYSLFLTAREAVMALQKGETTTTLRMQLQEANARPAITGLDVLPTVSNYYVGDSPAQYREGVRHFAKVKYAGVYPGIDVVYYGQQQQLEYDFIVAPGANPNAIKMQFAGATRLSLAENGDLLIGIEGGELRHHKPVVYQTINHERRTVAAQFVIRERQVSFAIGDYDRTKELVIDPSLSYSTYLGGYEGDEKAYGVAVASGCTSNCDAYITGEVASLTFPDTNISHAAGNGKDIFVAKLNAAGTLVTFFTFIGGTGDDIGRGIKVNSSGQSYVVGVMGSNYVVPGGVTGFQTTDPAADNEDGFVARLGAGGALQRFTYLGGSNSDQVNAIAFNDLNAQVCVTGQTYSANFPTAGTAYDTTWNGGFDVFVSRLSADLGTLNYSTFVGGGNMDYGNAIDVYQGVIYVSGNTQSSNFPTSTNGFDRTITGFAPVDAFVFKLNPALAAANELVYSTYLGGNGREYGYGVAVNKTNGEFYVCGRSNSQGANASGYIGTSNGFPVTNGTTLNGASDVFVTRFNASGGIVYSTLFGGSDYDIAYGMEISGTTVYLVGETDSSSAGTPFPLASPFQSDQPGTDAFFVKLNTAVPGALGLVFSTYFGGGDSDSFDSTDSARGVALAGTELYVVGFTNSASTASGGTFPIKPAVPYQEVLAGGGFGGTDCFAARLTP
ncbi:MAG: hypothetical protein U0Y68_13695 [Blastocatellia bacterium]